MNRKTAGLGMAAVAALILGAAVTYSSRSTVAAAALPLAAGMAFLILRPAVPILARYQTGTAAALAQAPAAVVAIAMFGCTPLVPRLDPLDASLAQLAGEIRSHPARATLLRAAAADGRVDMREIAEYRDRVRELRRRAEVDALVDPARDPR